MQIGNKAKTNPPGQKTPIGLSEGIEFLAVHQYEAGGTVGDLSFHASLFPSSRRRVD